MHSFPDETLDLVVIACWGQQHDRRTGRAAEDRPAFGARTEQRPLDEGEVEMTAGVALQRLVRTARRDNVVPPTGQRRGEEVALPLIGMRDEDVARSGDALGRASREPDREGGPRLHAALDRDLAAMVAEDAVADAQTESGAFADVAGGEEGIEDAREVGRIDAVTRVGDEHFNRVRLAIEPRANREPPRWPVPHRLFAVQNQIEQRLLELSAIGDRLRQPGLELGHELDVVEPQVVAAQRQHAADEIGNVLRHSRRALTPREREQVADDPRGALRFLGNAAEVLAELRRDARVRIGLEQFLFEQLRVADDAGEWVVQLVRHTGHELPDRGKLLGLEQLRLRRFQLLNGRHQLRVRRRQFVAHPPQLPGRLNLLRHVIRNLHHGGIVGATHRECRDGKDPAARQSDLRRRRRIAVERLADGAGRTPAPAETDLAAARVPELGHWPLEERGESDVAAKQTAGPIENRDRVANRVKRAFPLALAAAHRLVQPYAVDRRNELRALDRFGHEGEGRHLGTTGSPPPATGSPTTR